MDGLAEKVVHICVQHDIVKRENEGPIAFGISQLLFFCANLSAICAIGIILDHFLSACIYCAVYISVSGLTGSYHAPSRTQCSIKTIIVFCAYLVIILLTPGRCYLMLSVIGIGIYSIIAYVLAPVSHKNISYTPEQITMKRKKLGFRSLAWIMIVGICLCNLRYSQYGYAIASSLFITGILCVVGCAFNDK